MSPFHQALRRVRRDLVQLKAHWAFVGGIAIAARAYPRFTNDLDVAVAVASDSAAEALVFGLRQRGYEFVSQLERDDGRLALVRLALPTPRGPAIVVDLLFALSGIEAEAVAAADPITVNQKLLAPVAQAGHLVVMKLVSVGDHRDHDQRDLLRLLRDIDPVELARAREAIDLVIERGQTRGRDLFAMLDAYLLRAPTAE